MKKENQTSKTMKDSRKKEKLSPSSADAPAWEGGLDQKLLLKKDGQSPALFAAIQNRARQLGHTIMDTCEYLGYSYPYFNQVRAGRRPLTGASVPFTQACADYLGVPRLTVLALADIISPEDLYEKPTTIMRDLPRAFSFVVHDPRWLHLITDEVRDGSPELQYLIVRLYEEATDTRLLPEKIDLELLAPALEELRRMREEVKQPPSNKFEHKDTRN